MLHFLTEEQGFNDPGSNSVSYKEPIEAAMRSLDDVAGYGRAKI